MWRRAADRAKACPSGRLARGNAAHLSQRHWTEGAHAGQTGSNAVAVIQDRPATREGEAGYVKVCIDMTRLEA